MKARLVESVEIAPEVRHFTFAVDLLETLDFTPGQFVSFSRDVLGKSITRAYSIASAPSGNRFELCLNRVQDGRLSPWLFEMKPDDTIEMSGPLGYFVPKAPLRDAVFVATGTGVAPFRSFLRWPPVFAASTSLALLFGTRSEEGILYRREFEELTANRPGFRYLPTLTRPGTGWAGRAGRVQAHLDEALGGRNDIDVYVCGLKAMVDDVRTLLKSKGFDRKQIIVEKYD
ncbi:ferredoxin--NADP reductase [Paludibaculum fermentans]|uniref:Oxidoreductase n=1 Tax=Paludibaculum fermentans TaxID=1473598 RepID=A0A7S7SJ07_PALFE|nr:FAD-binding oxidoreductase [Paludibaculum fermentans]QOY86016.1 oxidoreductase [Paludibaculum fermentans]